MDVVVHTFHPSKGEAKKEGQELQVYLGYREKILSQHKHTFMHTHTHACTHIHAHTNADLGEREKTVSEHIAVILSPYHLIISTTFYLV